MADNKQTIEALIACSATRFEEGDRQWLEGLTAEQLSRLEPVRVEPAPAAPPPVAVNEAPAPKTAEEFLQGAPPEIAAVLGEALALHQARKDELVAKITGNARCKYTAEELATRDTTDLEKLVALIQPEVEIHRPGPRGNGQASFPAMPVMSWDK